MLNHLRDLSKEGRDIKTGLNGIKVIYLAVGLSKDGKQKTFRVHQLVAMTFLKS